MGKVLCYIYNSMADFEISLLLHRLKNTGKKEIVSISESTRVLTAQSGLQYQPQMTIEDMKNIEDVEALIIPGGPINNNQNDICKLAADIIQSGKLIGAICFAPQFLGRAGILNSYSFTTSCSEQKIQQLGCQDPFDRNNYVDKRCVVDRNLITAKGYAFVDFAIEVCKYMKIFSDENELYEQLQKVKESQG